METQMFHQSNECIYKLHFFNSVAASHVSQKSAFTLGIQSTHKYHQYLSTQKAQLH